MGNRKKGSAEVSGIYDWMDRALKGLYDPLDRRRVRKELWAHYGDRCAGYQSVGLRYAEAGKKALADLGDPEETSRLLRSVHKPWLGFSLQLARRLLLVGVLLVVVNLFKGNLSLSALGFMSRTEQKEILGLVSDYEKFEYRVLARREGRCSDEFDYGAFRVSLGDTALAFLQQDSTVERQLVRSFHYESELLLHFRAAPWHNLNEETIRRCLRVMDDRGEEIGRDRLSILVRRIRPWLTGVFIGIQKPGSLVTDTKWLELRLEQEDETKVLRVSFDDWKLEDWYYPKLEDEADAVLNASYRFLELDRLCLGYPKKLSVRQGIPVRAEAMGIQLSIPMAREELLREDPEGRAEVIASQLEWNPDWKPKMDSDTYYLTSCVLELRGRPEQYPVLWSKIGERLSVVAITADGEVSEPPIFYVSDKPLWYRDAAFWALQWESCPKAERYELRYAAEDGSVTRLELKLEKERMP